MVNELKTLKDATENNFSVVLFYAKGCSHCETIKPIFEEFSETYEPEIMFYRAEIIEHKESYDTFADQIPLLNEDGSETKDDNGNQILVPKYTIPNFYVFAKEAQAESNELGFVGGFDGANPEELQAVLNILQQKALGTV